MTLNLLFVRNISGSTAVRTFFLDDLTGTADSPDRSARSEPYRTETAGYNTTCPLPPHFGQVSGEVPGFAPVPWQVVHSSFRFSSISFSQPKIASSKVMRTLVRRLAPCIGPVAPPLLLSAAAKEIAENIAENIAHIRAAEIKAAEAACSAAPCSNAAWPNWSYCLRLSGSLRTAYASDASLNFCLRFFVARIHIRMIFFCQGTVCLFQRRVICILIARPGLRSNLSYSLPFQSHLSSRLYRDNAPDRITPDRRYRLICTLSVSHMISDILDLFVISVNHIIVR